MAGENTYQGQCFCGSVQIEISGAPIAQGYCHCESCRHWSAGPVNAYTLWNPQALKVTRGADDIGTYNKTEQSEAVLPNIDNDEYSLSSHWYNQAKTFESAVAQVFFQIRKVQQRRHIARIEREGGAQLAFRGVVLP